MEVSQRTHNTTYAPGIATYGIDGQPGMQGEPGTSMFFSAYDFTSKEFPEFAQKIVARKLPIKLEDIQLKRIYVNGDVFVSMKGDVYMLKDINKLSIDVKNGSIGDASSYMSYVGSFTQEALPFNTADNYNDPTIRRSSITITDAETQSTGNNALLSLIRKSNDYDSCDFINLEALYGSDANINLDITYEPKYKAFMIKSQYPILLNGNVYKSENTLQSSDIKGFSRIEPATNTLTSFMGKCSNIKYDIYFAIYEYTKEDSSTIYYGAVYKIQLITDQTSESLDSIFGSDTLIHFQNKSFQDFQLYVNNTKTYQFKQNYDFVKYNDIYNHIKYVDLKDIQISVIKGIEVYLKQNDIITDEIA